MYDFATEKYSKHEAQVWKKRLSYEDNIMKVQTSSMGRCFDLTVNYTDALANHYDAEAAKANMAAVHAWLSSKGKADRKALECEPAYDLRIWQCFSGDSPSLKSVLFSHFSFGLLEAATGRTKGAAQSAAVFRVL
jgi:hypothetical protein